MEKKEVKVEGIKIKIGKQVVEVSMEDAKELLDSLKGCLGEEQSSAMKLLEEYKKLAEQLKPITVPVPYPVYPQPVNPWWTNPYNSPYYPYPHSPWIVYTSGGSISNVSMFDVNGGSVSGGDASANGGCLS